jgi:hypothetical protein
MQRNRSHTLIPLLKLLLVEVGCFLQLVELRGRKLRLSVSLESVFILARVNDHPDNHAKGPAARIHPFCLDRGISGVPVASAQVPQG